jgi:hypothetical protein
MLRDRLDRVDGRDVDLAQRIAVVSGRMVAASSAGIIPIRPIASAANTSICHQIR